MEISGAIGAAAGPFFGSSLNYAFGYEGPFIFFASVYLIMFYLISRNIPSDYEPPLLVSTENKFIVFNTAKSEMPRRIDSILEIEQKSQHDKKSCDSVNVVYGVS